jgi:hypothetical protein
MFRYRTEIPDAGMPLLVVAALMPMPSFAVNIDVTYSFLTDVATEPKPQQNNVKNATLLLGL